MRVLGITMAAQCCAPPGNRPAVLTLVSLIGVL
jgi:hypothetical protein